jgi:hypothetical protein
MADKKKKKPASNSSSGFEKTSEATRRDDLFDADFSLDKDDTESSSSKEKKD